MQSGGSASSNQPAQPVNEGGYDVRYWGGRLWWSYHNATGVWWTNAARSMTQLIRSSFHRSSIVSTFFCQPVFKTNKRLCSPYYIKFQAQSVPQPKLTRTWTLILLLSSPSQNGLNATELLCIVACCCSLAAFCPGFDLSYHRYDRTFEFAMTIACDGKTHASAQCTLSNSL